MKPHELLSQTLTPDGAVLKLVRRDTEYIILAGGAVLMSSRRHASEDALATLACQRLRILEQPSVLIGGLGMGFTLRATLDLLPPRAHVFVAELLPAIVDWNRGLLSALAEHPLNDPRVHVEIGDVAVVLNSRVAQFDAILLDVDNGPSALTTPKNTALYDHRGITSAHAALKTNGALALWAAQEDRAYAQRLRRAGFSVQFHHERARGKKGGSRHTIFLARKP